MSKLLILIILCCIGCKAPETYQQLDSVIQIVTCDTICIESDHIHINEDHICGYFDDIKIIIRDTIKIEI